MKKKVLLLQFRTDESREHEQKQILKMGGFKREDVKIVNVLDKRYKIPQSGDVDKYAGVITGASGQFNVTNWSKDVEERVRQVYPFFKALVMSDTPTLAICFGHQLVAKLFDGEVARDEDQSEAGTYEITLTNNGRRSKIFKNIPTKFNAVAGHKDSVTKLPKEAVHLASSKRCKYHSYKLTDSFISTQFHPELDRDALVWRLALYPDYMKGRSLDEVKAEFMEIPHARNVISNFRKEFVES